MNYSEEYIGLCKRLAELMEVVPEVGWTGVAYSWKSPILVVSIPESRMKDKKVDFINVVMPKSMSPWETGLIKLDDVIFTPPLKRLARWLREHTRFKLISSCGGWRIALYEVFDSDDRYLSLDAPTPEEAVLRALIAVLEKEANNGH
jgi:hypothetical protein